MKFLDITAITFDDVLLVPQRSTISSRFGGEINLSTRLFPVAAPDLKLIYPIISANMDTVTEKAMVCAMEEAGGTGIVHRFMDKDTHATQLASLPGHFFQHKIGCIGVGEASRQRMKTIEPWINAILIDVAHGHSNEVIEQIKWVKANWPKLPIIAGNIATREAACDLIGAGVDCLKVGVGPGSLCTTRIKTGCGYPQLSAIMEVAEQVEDIAQPVTVIADGGIRSSGDIVKALAAGAHAVMVGGLFAGTTEAPGKCYRDEEDRLYKIYRGMASRAAQEDWKGYATSIEGEMRRVPFKGPVTEIFNELVGGILSGMSYLNAHNLNELKENAVFVRQTSNGYRESIPHGL